MSHTPVLVTDPFIQSELRAIEEQLGRLSCATKAFLVQANGQESACYEISATLPLTMRNEVLRRAIASSGSRRVETCGITLTQHHHVTTTCLQSHSVLRVESTIQMWHEIEEVESHDYLHLQVQPEGLLRIHCHTKEKRLALAPVQDQSYGVTTSSTTHTEGASIIDCITQEGVVYAVSRAKSAVASIHTLL